MREIKRCFLFPAVLALALLLSAAASGHQDPEGCVGVNGHADFAAETIELFESPVRLGDEITIGASFTNQGFDSCTLSDITVQVRVEPEGGAGETFTLINGLTLSGGWRAGSFADPWVVNAPPGVFEIPITLSWTATAHSGDQDILVSGEPVAAKLAVTRPEAVLKITPDKSSGEPPLTVTYTYSLTNTSPAASSGFPAPKLIPSGPAGSHDAIADESCEPVTYLSGDGPLVDGAGIEPAVSLDLHETWLFSCTRTFNLPGTYVNAPSIQATSDTDERPWPQVQAEASVTVTGADLVVSKSHQGDFLAGRSGDYTLKVTNRGNKATSGQVSVTDLLPEGLSATAISGSGWACSLASLTCTRSDPLGSGSSYPDLKLSVKVAAKPPNNVVNRATVSGGGESPGVNSNNSATDPTRINIPGQPTKPAVRFKLKRVKTRANGSTLIKVSVAGAGRLTADDARKPDLIRRSTRKTGAAGTYTLVLKARPKLRRQLRRSKGPRKIRVRVSFKAKGGSTISTVRPVTFKLGFR